MNLFLIRFAEHGEEGGLELKGGWRLSEFLPQKGLGLSDSQLPVSLSNFELGAFLSTKKNGFSFNNFILAKRKWENFLLMLVNETAFSNQFSSGIVGWMASTNSEFSENYPRKFPHTWALQAIYMKHKYLNFPDNLVKFRVQTFTLSTRC